MLVQQKNPVVSGMSPMQSWQKNLAEVEENLYTNLPNGGRNLHKRYRSDQDSKVYGLSFNLQDLEYESRLEAITLTIDSEQTSRSMQKVQSVEQSIITAKTKN